MEDIVPNYIQLETINGRCTARCVMCTWQSWTRKPMVMDSDAYGCILEKLKPYRDHIQYVTLHFCGEPLLDKGLAEKIRIAKEMGFGGTGFATNCTELNENRSQELMKAGLDTIICSVDGINKDTHESIRVGTDFDKVVSNIKNFIKIRNRSGQTRVIIRFIRQETNKQEWQLFVDYWSKQLNKDFGDEVIKFDVHNWADQLDEYQYKDLNRGLGLDKYICRDIFERMAIYSNGDVALCCADDNGFFELGNVIHSDPIRVYNDKIFKHYRKMMLEGRIFELEHCKTCTIPRSRALNLEGRESCPQNTDGRENIAEN